MEKKKKIVILKKRWLYLCWRLRKRTPKLRKGKEKNSDTEHGGLIRARTCQPVSCAVDSLEVAPVNPCNGRAIMRTEFPWSSAAEKTARPNWRSSRLAPDHIYSLSSFLKASSIISFAICNSVTKCICAVEYFTSSHTCAHPAVCVYVCVHRREPTCNWMQQRISTWFVDESGSATHKSILGFRFLFSLNWIGFPAINNSAILWHMIRVHTSSAQYSRCRHLPNSPESTIHES
jgi:hypothetical protein